MHTVKKNFNHHPIKALLSIIVITFLMGCVSKIPHKKLGNPVIATSMANVLFKGIENPIHVAIPNFPCDELHIIAPNCIIKGEGCQYTITPQKLGYQPIILASIVNNDTIVLGQSEFRVKLLPAPKAFLCNYRNTVKKEDLKNCAGIVLRYENLQWDSPYKITQYNLSVLRNDCMVFRLISNQAKFTRKIRQALQEVKAGDILYFENIRAIDSSNKTIKVYDPDTLEEIDTKEPSMPKKISDFKILVLN